MLFPMETFRRLLLGALLGAMICMVAAAAYFAPGFLRSVRKAMALPAYDQFNHVDGAAARIADGRILLIGSSLRHPELNAEIYEPSTNAFQPVAQMEGKRMFHPFAVTMADGRILAAGGSRDVGNDVLDLEAYDPSANRWSTIGRLPKGIRLSDIASLPDGRVLLGTEEGGADGLLCFDPRVGRVLEVGHPAMVVNGSARLTSLQDGRVLVTHLEYGEQDAAHSNAFLFDPRTDTTALLPRMAQGRQNHEATLLADGRVLVSGGADGEPSAELFDPAKGAFRAMAPMVAPRCLHCATLMDDGRVLIVGGVSSAPNGSMPNPEALIKMSPDELREALRKARPDLVQLKAEAEVYDPSTGRFSPVSDPPSPIHVGHAGLHQLMTDGRVLFMSINGPLYYEPRSNRWEFPARPQAR